MHEKTSEAIVSEVFVWPPFKINNETTSSTASTAERHSPVQAPKRNFSHIVKQEKQ